MFLFQRLLGKVYVSRRLWLLSCSCLAAAARGTAKLEGYCTSLQGGAKDPKALAAKYVGKNGVASVQDALAGAKDIVAEMAAEVAEIREAGRQILLRSGTLTSTVNRATAAALAAANGPFAAGRGQQAAARPISPPAGAAKASKLAGKTASASDPHTYQRYFNFQVGGADDWATPDATILAH